MAFLSYHCESHPTDVNSQSTKRENVVLMRLKVRDAGATCARLISIDIKVLKQFPAALTC